MVTTLGLAGVGVGGTGVGGGGAVGGTAVGVAAGPQAATTMPKTEIAVSKRVSLLLYIVSFSSFTSYWWLFLPVRV
jgi:hypothetical protein